MLCDSAQEGIAPNSTTKLPRFRGYIVEWSPCFFAG